MKITMHCLLSMLFTCISINYVKFLSINLLTKNVCVYVQSISTFSPVDRFKEKTFYMLALASVCTFSLWKSLSVLETYLHMSMPAHSCSWSLHMHH